MLYLLHPPASTRRCTCVHYPTLFVSRDAVPSLLLSALHRSARSLAATCRPGVAAVFHRARSTQSPAADNVCNSPRFPHPAANAAAPTSESVAAARRSQPVVGLREVE